MQGPRQHNSGNQLFERPLMTVVEDRFLESQSKPSSLVVAKKLFPNILNLIDTKMDLRIVAKFHVPDLEIIANCVACRQTLPRVQQTTDTSIFTGTGVRGTSRGMQSQVSRVKFEKHLGKL